MHVLWFTDSTKVWHYLEQDHSVTGFEEPGSYVREIIYSASIQQVIALIDITVGCKQHINLKCFGAHFHSESNEIHHWWQNRDGDVMYNWGAPTGTDGCDCSTQNGTVHMKWLFTFH